MENKNIYQALDAILRSASRNDKSRITRNIRLQNKDRILLENNFSERLSKILYDYWKINFSMSLLSLMILQFGHFY